MATSSLTRMARAQKYLEGNSGWSSLDELNTILEQAYQKLRTEGVPE